MRYRLKTKKTGKFGLSYSKYGGLPWSQNPSILITRLYATVKKKEIEEISECFFYGSSLPVESIAMHPFQIFVLQSQALNIIKSRCGGRCFAFVNWSLKFWHPFCVVKESLSVRKK